MIKLLKKNIEIKNKIFLKTLIGNIQIFYIDKIIKIPKNVNIEIKKKILNLKVF